MPYAHPEYLISPAELADDLDNAKRRIFDATVFLTPAPTTGYRAESGIIKFDAGHIPGAMFLDLMQAASDTTTGLGFSLAPIGQLEGLLQRLGVEDDSQVVLYSTGHMMWATRAWWLFRYCGHEHVQVLNGGFRAWKANDLPVSTDTTSYPVGTYRTAPKANLFADKDAVLAAIGDEEVCTVNALSSDVHAGAGDFSYGRKGHIAGSLNVYYDDLMSDGYFKADAELRRALDAKGLLSAPKVITYCGGGISATIDSFACLLVGQENVAVYDGSMSEWVRDESLPMETGT